MIPVGPTGTGWSDRSLRVNVSASGSVQPREPLGGLDRTSQQSNRVTTRGVASGPAKP